MGQFSVTINRAWLHKTLSIDWPGGDMTQMLEPLVDRAQQVPVDCAPQAENGDPPDLRKIVVIGIDIERVPRLFKQDYMS